jgi:hypothetical protein
MVPRPFGQNRFFIELAPDFANLQPAEDHVNIGFVGIELKAISGLTHAMKPTEKQE